MLFFLCAFFGMLWIGGAIDAAVERMYEPPPPRPPADWVHGLTTVVQAAVIAVGMLLAVIVIGSL